MQVSSQVVDLPEERLAGELEAAKVVLFVRIVVRLRTVNACSAKMAAARTSTGSALMGAVVKTLPLSSSFSKEETQRRAEVNFKGRSESSCGFKGRGRV